MIDSSETLKNRSSYLKELELEIYTEGHICRIGGEIGYDSNFCAKAVKVFDDKHCSGDSGGALVAKVRFDILLIFLLLFLPALHASTMIL